MAAPYRVGVSRCAPRAIACTMRGMAAFTGSVLCLVVVAGTVGAGAVSVGATPVAATVDCSLAGAATVGDIAREVIQIHFADTTDGFGSIGIRTPTALEAGTHSIVVVSDGENPVPADVLVTVDGEPLLRFVAVPPGAGCAVSFELPAGIYVATSTVTGDADTSWDVVAGSGAAPELTVEVLIPLGDITGGSAPVLVGDDGDAVGGYTSACAVLTPELIRIALSISAETTNDVDRTGTPDGEPVNGVWPARCGWHASYVGGPTGGVDVSVSLPIPGAISIDYDAAHESYLDVGEAIELPLVGDRCYVARGFARCPFGNGSGEISIGVNATGEELSNEFAVASASLLANVITRLN